MSVPAQAKLLRSYQTSVGEAEKEEEELRKTLDKIYLIRNLRNEMRLAARASGNKENIRRAAHMKMLANSAQVSPIPDSDPDPDFNCYPDPNPYPDPDPNRNPDPNPDSNPDPDLTLTLTPTLIQTLT